MLQYLLQKKMKIYFEIIYSKSRKFSILNNKEENFANKKSEDPFLAKPKLLRTPPTSACVVSNHSNNKFKGIRNKVK